MYEPHIIPRSPFCSLQTGTATCSIRRLRPSWCLPGSTWVAADEVWSLGSRHSQCQTHSRCSRSQLIGVSYDVDVDAPDPMAVWMYPGRPAHVHSYVQL